MQNKRKEIYNKSYKQREKDRQKKKIKEIQKWSNKKKEKMRHKQRKGDKKIIYLKMFNEFFLKKNFRIKNEKNFKQIITLYYVIKNFVIK